MDQKTIGNVLLVVGIVLLLASLTADMTGIGQAPRQFGGRQIIGSVAGLVLAVVGGYAYWRARR